MRINDIRDHEISDSAIASCVFLEPKIGSTYNSYSFLLSGYLVYENCAPETIVVQHSCFEEASARLSDVTQTMRRLLKIGSDEPAVGFSLHVNTLGMPPDFDLAVSIRLRKSGDENDRLCQVATISCSRTFDRAVERSRFNPLLVTGLGRSGTTALMALLKAHSRVVVDESYPYETAIASYWMHAMRIATAPADHEHSTPVSGFFSNVKTVGSNPYFDSGLLNRYGPQSPLNRFFGSDQVIAHAEHCRRLIDQFYGVVATHVGKPKAFYFAEKGDPRYVPWMFWEFYEHTKELIVVRDPRDVLCSVRAFFSDAFYQSDTEGSPRN